jgi:hypothetical protein
MSVDPDSEDIRRVMSLLGRSKSQKKVKAARENVKKAHEARRKKKQKDS